jgi:hypothetical protein
MMRNQMGYHLTAERDDELKRRQPVFGEQDCGSASDVIGRSRYRMIETVPHNDVRTDYAVPVRRLLSIGETRNYDPAEWPDYAAKFGLRREHIDELIRLACDAALNWGDPDSPEVWAPLHAWRALGQLRAEVSVAPLLAFLKTAEDDEAVGQEFPIVFAPPRFRILPDFSSIDPTQHCGSPQQSKGSRKLLSGIPSVAPNVSAFWRGRWNGILTRIGLSTASRYRP